MTAALDYLRRANPYITVMEVCGTHTAAIAGSGLLSLLPPGVRLVSGPGCPVCVTCAGFIDQVIAYAKQTNAVVAGFGDLFRVRGASLSFGQAKAEGGDFRVLYSPLEAIAIAKANPSRPVVLAAVGFETTAPLYALVLETAINEGVGNLLLAASLKTMPAAMAYVCEAGGVDGLICPGHVAAVTGAAAFRPLLKYRKPLVIAGFKPEGIAAAIALIARQIAGGNASLANLYTSAVSEQGNAHAAALLCKYFEPCDALWRGIGVIPASGLRLRSAYAAFNLPIAESDGAPPPDCRCGDVLLGKALPGDCPLFGAACSPENPVGACMASTEGACGIHAREGGL